MNLSIFIARRYLFSKKKQNAINIISIISMVGVAIGTTALIVVLSVSTESTHSSRKQPTVSPRISRFPRQKGNSSRPDTILIDKLAVCRKSLPVIPSWKKILL